MRWGLFIILLIASPVFAKQGTITLLAVSEESPVLEGDIATLYLETRPGTGHVFLETFPLSKADTQISMRFAKQVACSKLPINCDTYDFIFTLRANSAVISGPSAGAAAAVLTYAVLSDLPIAKDVTITGTINSGGIIGGVGGIRQKIDAASTSGITTVLIPLGKGMLKDQNKSIDLFDYGKNKNIKVIEVKDFEEAIIYITGKKIEQPNITLNIDNLYQSLMKNISFDLCKRASLLEQQYLTTGEEIDLNKLSFFNQAKQADTASQHAFENGDYYSAASFCFRKGISYHYLYLDHKNFSESKIKLTAWKLRKQSKKFGDYINTRNISTITDLQTFIIVSERITETLGTVDEILKMTHNNSQTYQIAQATERLESAIVWSRFFNKGGTNYLVNNVSLKASCEDKIREAQERYQYVQIYIPRTLETIKKGIEYAGEDLFAGRFELCLSKASKAKAEADVIISVIGSDASQLPKIIENKLQVAKRSIHEAQQKGIFPILGFSYYQFANSLATTEPQTAMLFAEYAIEFSNLDMYFQKQTPQMYPTGIFDLFSDEIFSYIPWALGGIILALLVITSQTPRA
ncbi:MAG: S16 family serine protease [Nanoarchaeota archaeon]